MYEPYYLSCNNNFILYSEISFSSMHKYICCIHVVSHPSFLFLLSLPPISLPPILLPSSLPLFPSPLSPYILPRSSPFTTDVYLSGADIETCQIRQCRHLANIVSEIVKFTLFTWYFCNAVTRFISVSGVLSGLQQRDSV